MARSTRDTLAWGREAIVSLTQTEIMLVLAVVILLLLLAKNVDLAAAEADVEAVRQLNAALEERTKATQEEILEQKTQADLAREVKDVLVRGGSGPPPDSATPSLQPGDVATIEKAIRQQTAEQQAVDEALRRAGVVDQGRHKANRIEELGAEAGLAKVLRESLSPERRRELQEAMERDRLAAGHDASQRVESGVSDSEQVGTSEADEGRDDEAVKRLLAEWLHDSPTREGRRGSGDQVGFDPCWPGSGGHQERRYYIAFNITYQDKRFLVTPHPDWRAGVATVDRALSGPLAVLREHPRGWTTRERLHEFGRRVEEALKPMRTRGEYVDECLLVTTLNEEASGAVAKFLRVTVGLYPITRDTKRTPG